jgi:cyclophilin family peptidyl-prolyl cis-trans isomerase
MKGASVKTITVILLIAAVCLVGMPACSDNGEAKDDTKGSEATAEAKKQEPMKTESDSLNKKGPSIRDPENPIVTLQTSMGDMTLELYRDVAPAHADSFVARTKEGFYDSLIFHRVVKNFMIQGGDPQGNGSGNAGYYLPAEFSDLPHTEGTLSMARSRDPNSASCQFFICLARNQMTRGLDRQYTIFGHLLKGYETLHAIGDIECRANPHNPREISKPVVDVVIEKAFLSDADGNPL